MPDPCDDILDALSRLARACAPAGVAVQVSPGCPTGGARVLPDTPSHPDITTAACALVDILRATPALRGIGPVQLRFDSPETVCMHTGGAGQDRAVALASAAATLGALRARLAHLPGPAPSRRVFLVGDRRLEAFDPGCALLVALALEAPTAPLDAARISQGQARLMPVFERLEVHACARYAQAWLDADTR